MVQETVRYSESIVEGVDELLEDDMFETKSEFYRFAAELLLSSLQESYEPEMLNYDRIAERTRQHTREAPTEPSGKSMFYESAVTIRRHARRNEISAAETHIDRHYPPERGEHLLLEALLDYYHDANSVE